MPEKPLQTVQPERQQYAGEDEVLPPEPEDDPYMGNTGHSAAYTKVEHLAESPPETPEVSDSSP